MATNLEALVFWTCYHSVYWEGAADFSCALHHWRLISFSKNKGFCSFRSCWIFSGLARGLSRLLHDQSLNFKVICNCWVLHWIFFQPFIDCSPEFCYWCKLSRGKRLLQLFWWDKVKYLLCGSWRDALLWCCWSKEESSTEKWRKEAICGFQKFICCALCEHSWWEVRKFPKPYSIAERVYCSPLSQCRSDTLLTYRRLPFPQTSKIICSWDWLYPWVFLLRKINLGLFLTSCRLLFQDGHMA